MDESINLKTGHVDGKLMESEKFEHMCLFVFVDFCCWNRWIWYAKSSPIRKIDQVPRLPLNSDSGIWEDRSIFLGGVMKNYEHFWDILAVTLRHFKDC